MTSLWANACLKSAIKTLEHCLSLTLVQEIASPLPLSFFLRVFFFKLGGLQMCSIFTCYQKKLLATPNHNGVRYQFHKNTFVSFSIAFSMFIYFNCYFEYCQSSNIKLQCALEYHPHPPSKTPPPSFFSSLFKLSKPPSIVVFCEPP